jgi:hypothetical protein
MGIGGFIGDAIRDITGGVDLYNNGLFRSPDIPNGAMAVITNTLSLWGVPLVKEGSASDIGYSRVFFNASLVVPTANENRPASVSAYLCIKY